MPELPDIEEYKKRFEKHNLNKTICEVEVIDDTVLEADSNKLKEAVESHQFIEAKRHGKYLFAITGGNKFPVLHFGMTGDIEFVENIEKKYPEYTKVAFKFTNDYLAYKCPRKLGSIFLTSSLDNFIKEHDLGPDALKIDFQEFYEIFKNKRGMLKTAIMDQSSIAGIGNVYADEVCFQTKIHPKQKVNDFDKEKWQKIYKSIKDILEKASERNINQKPLPDSWISTLRKEEDKCPKCKGEIKRIEVSGRGTYFCPSCQNADI